MKILENLCLPKKKSNAVFKAGGINKARIRKTTDRRRNL